MANVNLTKCNNCGKTISKNATECHECGVLNPLKRNSHIKHSGVKENFSSSTIHIIPNYRPSFFKVPLTYVFMFFGYYVGKALGGIMGMLIIGWLSAGIGYAISLGLDNVARRKWVRIFLKISVCIVSFFLSLILHVISNKF